MLSLSVEVLQSCRRFYILLYQTIFPTMKTKLILGLCLLIMTQNVYGQRKASNAAAAGAAVALVGAAIYYEQQMRENVEQSAVEWALDNFPIAKGDILEMKLLNWEAKAATDLSNTRNLVFKYKLNDEPYKVLLFITSQGWWNEYGVVFEKVKVVEIDKDFWSSVLFALCEVAIDDDRVKKMKSDSIVISIVVNDYSQNTNVRKTKTELVKFEISNISKLKNNTIEFTKGKSQEGLQLISLNGDEHIFSFIPDTDLVIDYNENRIHLYNRETKDLIKLSKKVTNDITELLFIE